MRIAPIWLWMAYKLRRALTTRLASFEGNRANLQCSQTGLEKPHEITLELVYRVENRCKSIGARAGGLLQAFLGPIWPQNLNFQT